MELEVKPGIRVVRGPDWKWGNQDGGEGHVGTVVEVKITETSPDNHASKIVLVQWDNGNRFNYRCGIEGKHDLLVYDYSPICIVHSNVICDSCRENDIKGMRWKCTKCYDFDLCTSCYMNGKHSLDHEFQRLDSPNTPGITLSNRSSEKRIQAKGLFPNAEVSRGYDWIWGDQDGVPGSKGRLDGVKGWESESFRSVAEVVWSETKKVNVYRIGHKGKVDIKADVPGDGLLYYISHLPVLGKSYEIVKPPSTGDKLPVTEEKFKDEKLAVGDLVRVQLDLDLFKSMQEGHGGWNDGMLEILTLAGTVHNVLENGDVRVQFQNRTWTINQASLTKVAQHSKGDVVQVIDDMSTVYSLQEGHGGWVDDMALALGQVGRVVNVFPTGDTRVSVNGRVWTFNPMNLVAAPGETPLSDGPVDDGVLSVPEDVDMQLRLLSLLENPAVIVAAAANGDVKVLKDFLTKHPDQVNAIAAGKAAIHCASVAGNIDVLKCLLEFNADVELQDEDGDRPLHLCAYGNEEEAAKLILDNDADVNALNHRGATPLIIAAAKGHASVVKVLLQSPTIIHSIQDQDGDNALHHGVMGQRHTVMSALLDAGFDIELVNFRLFTPIHEAARIGFLPAIEMFIKHNPVCVNLQKDDGYTPLHLAALNNHLDVLTTILDSDKCNIDAMTNELQTALHISVHQGHGSIVERLVGFGANLNSQDKDGDTPLHVAMMRETLAAISTDAPRLQKVRANFNIEDASATSSAVMACFLVQEGANLYMQNHKGNTPLLICSPEIAALVTKFVDENKEEQSTFHGSLCATRGIGGLHASNENNPPAASVLVSKLKQPSTGSCSEYSVDPLLPQTPDRPNADTFSKPNSIVDGKVAVECLLCDGKVDCILQPCNHAVLCIDCSKIAKKCPQCKERVTSTVARLSLQCSMCEEEEATVTLKPCDHKFCAGCCARMKKCAECKVLIQFKVGLSDSHHSHVNLQQQQQLEPIIKQQLSQSALCEICCEKQRDTALTCGHQFCNDCSQKVDNCPVCRKFIQHRIVLYQ